MCCYLANCLLLLLLMLNWFCNQVLFEIKVHTLRFIHSGVVLYLS